ncbi:MAG: 4Fe-4S dicluster-binding protein [Dysgonomonas sp.]|nr:4Fe-4S dicluster-binding protein [Dysgonomonas sp.]
MFRKEKRKIISLQIFERKCIGCERCVDRCERNVLGMIYGEKYSYATVEFPERCTGCALCSFICPLEAIELITA